MKTLELRGGRHWIEVSPKVHIELILEGDRLNGIGEVTIDGVAVRSSTVPLRPDFSTCDAIHYQDFFLEEIVRKDQEIRVRTKALGRPEVLGNDMMDEYDLTIAFPKVRGNQEAELDWIITGRELELDGEQYTGFSLGFEFRGGKNEIHRFLTTGTWEIGGRATGNTIYHQSQVAEPVYTAAPDTHYTTACLKRLDLWNDPLGNSYQFCPRWGSMQPFDFQSAQEGVLLGYWLDRHSVRSLIQKNPGEEVIFVLDEYNFELTNHAVIPAKHILFSPGPKPGVPRPKHEVVNMWTRAMEYTGDIVRGFFGIKLCPTLPVIEHPSVANIFWPTKGQAATSRKELAKGPQDDWLWREEKGKFYFLLEGEKVESHDLLRWIADKVLPGMHKLGLKRYYLGAVHESDFTEFAFDYKAQTGWHGETFCSSICGSHRYVPAELYGGWSAWRYLADQARRLEISVGHWVGLHLTPRAPILSEHPEYLVTHAHTKHFSGGYGTQSICSINWRSGARDWFLDDLRRWHEEGLEWLWFDSWPNLANISCSYADRMAPMQLELAEVLADLQRIGHEYMACNEAMYHIAVNPDRSLDEAPDWSFRYIANRSLNLVSEGDMRTYMALFPLMQKRYLLPEDRGVRWLAEDGKQEVLFAYTAFAHPVPASAKVTKVAGTTEQPVACPGQILHTEPHTAYRIA